MTDVKGKLYLIPVTIGSADYEYVIPEKVLSISRSLRLFVVEDLRSSRRFLRMIDPGFPINDTEFSLLNKDTEDQELDDLIKFAHKGIDIGLMSEAGLPAIADPGSKLVSLAHKTGIRVIPLSGPSSIVLALISSGLGGQNFAFNGYLPIKKAERIRSIKKLEQLAINGQTQLFMETPYRNLQLFADLKSKLRPDIQLCIASAISTDDEFILTLPVSEWNKRDLPDIHKKPAVFILGPGPS